MKDYKRILVTSALPYANGPLHIGHLAGAYVPPLPTSQEGERDVHRRQ